MSKIQLVIEIPNYDYEYIMNNCIVPIKFDNHIYEAIRNGTPLPKGHGVLTIPENPTNGDIIRALFPNVEVKEKNNGYEIYFGVGTAIQFFNYKWWNAPYKEDKADDDIDG